MKCRFAIILGFAAFGASFDAHVVAVNLPIIAAARARQPWPSRDCAPTPLNV